jgi:hypothetical protein
LFDDDDHAAAEAVRPSIVSPAQRSPRAKAKAATKRTEDGWPVHSFQTLLADLATLTQVRPRGADRATLDILATPTPLQQRAFELLGVSFRLYGTTLATPSAAKARTYAPSVGELRFNRINAGQVEWE